MAKKDGQLTVFMRMWFAVTPQERMLLLGIVLVALFGLTARFVHDHRAAKAAAQLETTPLRLEEAHE
jgi:hypothetical protein